MIGMVQYRETKIVAKVRVQSYSEKTVAMNLPRLEERRKRGGDMITTFKSESN